MLQASVASPFSSAVRPTLRAARKLHAMVAFELTVPGVDSREPRKVLADALSNHVRIVLVSTDRRRDCLTLRVEVPQRVFTDVVGVIVGRFREAMIGSAVLFSKDFR